MIDEGDSDLAMGLLESGFRDPKQIEGIVKSAKNNGIDLRKFDADRFKNNPLQGKGFMSLPTHCVSRALIT